jgi:hypothetical protein
VGVERLIGRGRLLQPGDLGRRPRLKVVGQGPVLVVEERPAQVAAVGH